MQRRGRGAAVAVLERQPVSLDAVVRLGRDGQLLQKHDPVSLIAHKMIKRNERTG